MKPLITAAVAVAGAAALAATASMLAISWGGGSWILDAAGGAAVLTAALLGRDRAALGLALAAAVVAHVAGLPQEPGPGAAVALAYLTGRAAARRAYPVPAAAGGLVAVSWMMDGFTAVTVIATLAWVAGLISGTSVAVAAAPRGRPAPPAGPGADAAADRAR